MQVQLIYTGIDMNTDAELAPEVFNTYQVDMVDTQRDPALRQMIIDTFLDGQARKNGIWSTKVVPD